MPLEQTDNCVTEEDGSGSMTTEEDGSGSVTLYGSVITMMLCWIAAVIIY